MNAIKYKTLMLILVSPLWKMKHEIIMAQKRFTFLKALLSKINSIDYIHPKNIPFYDRLRNCISKIEDSFFNSKPSISYSIVIVNCLWKFDLWTQF